MGLVNVGRENSTPIHLYYEDHGSGLSVVLIHGSFSMKLAFVLQGASYSAGQIKVEAAVTIEPEGQGFRISRSALTVHAQVPNLDEATPARMVGDAEKGCPVSRVLNAAITVDAKYPRRRQRGTRVRSARIVALDSFSGSQEPHYSVNQDPEICQWIRSIRPKKSTSIAAAFLVPRW
jgi:hypothetical protein